MSTEPPEPGILEQPPRSRTAPLLDRETLLRTFAMLGMLEGALALLAFFAAYWSAGGDRVCQWTIAATSTLRRRPWLIWRL